MSESPPKLFSWYPSKQICAYPVYTLVQVDKPCQCATGLYFIDFPSEIDLPEKLFGVYPHRVERRSSMLMRGFDDVFMVPHSRHTSVRREDIERCGKLKILASSEQAGVYAMATEGGRQIDQDVCRQL